MKFGKRQFLVTVEEVEKPSIPSDGPVVDDPIDDDPIIDEDPEPDPEPEPELDEDPEPDPEPELDNLNVVRLRQWAKDIHFGVRVPPLANCWESHHSNCAWQLEQLEAGALLLPTFRNLASPNMAVIDNASATGKGVFAGWRQLAEFAGKHSSPICVRIGNVEDEAAEMLRNTFAENPFIWDADYSGNAWVGDITLEVGESRDDLSDPTIDVVKRGDFFVIQGIGIYQKAIVAGVEVHGRDRLVAQVDNPNLDNPEHWKPNRYFLSLHSDVSLWRKFADAWVNGFIQQLAEYTPNAPLVIWLVNAEPRIGTSRSEDSFDFRMERDYPGIDLTGTKPKQNGYEASFIERRLEAERMKAMYDRLRALQPSQWKDVRVVAYGSCGGDHSFNLRPRSGGPSYHGWDNTTDVYSRMNEFPSGAVRGIDWQPDTMIFGGQGTEYGLEWTYFDGGSYSKYLHNPQGHGLDCQIRNRFWSEQGAAKIADWVRSEKRNDWLQCVSIYPQAKGKLVQWLKDYGIYSPTRTAGCVKYLSFLMNSALTSFFANHFRMPLDEEWLSADELSHPDFLSVGTKRIDHVNAMFEATESLWSNSDYIESLGWDLDQPPMPQNGDAWEFLPMGPLAEQGGDRFCLTTDSYPTFVRYKVNSTDSPSYCLCRRNGKGSGVVFAWNPKDGPKEEVVHTSDGNVTVTATQDGTFTPYSFE